MMLRNTNKLFVILAMVAVGCTVEEAPRDPFTPGPGGGDSNTTCTPECGPRECGLDPVCGLSCGVCAIEAQCDTGAGICTFPDGPILVNVAASSSMLTPFDDVELTVIASDPDGVEDVLGGVLLDNDTGATYGSFVATATPGTYTFSLSWPGVDTVRTIDAPPAGVARTFRIEFFDAANHRVADTTDLTLTCDETGITACSGICTDLMIDPDNCGTCGVPVPANPPGLSCENGSPTCPGGGTACDNECVDTNTSLLHCGGCDIPVPTGGTCEMGVPTCAGGGVACGSECVDTNTSLLHCGDCDTPVPEGGTCEMGVPTCPGGGTACGAACVDTNTSLAHCGDCDVAVPSGGTCETGVPTCPSPTIDCSGVCTNTSTDVTNCGGCGVPVPTGGVCVDGVPGCPTGEENCSGICQTSCAGDCSNECTNGLYAECSCDVSDPCGWSNDGACDVGVQTGDCGSFLPTFDDHIDCGTTVDCGTECTDAVYTSCTCDPTDPCSWSNDGYCDIGQISGDCGSFLPTFDDGSDCSP